jgi:hypothetical protein
MVDQTASKGKKFIDGVAGLRRKYGNAGAETKPHPQSASSRRDKEWNTKRFG